MSVCSHKNSGSLTSPSKLTAARNFIVKHSHINSLIVVYSKSCRTWAALELQVSYLVEEKVEKEEGNLCVDQAAHQLIAAGHNENIPCVFVLAQAIHRLLPL